MWMYLLRIYKNYEQIIITKEKPVVFSKTFVFILDKISSIILKYIPLSPLELKYDLWI